MRYEERAAASSRAVSAELRRPIHRALAGGRCASIDPAHARRRVAPGPKNDSRPLLWELGVGERYNALDNQGRYFDLGSLEVTSFASRGRETSGINNDNPSIGGGDSCAKGDCICPDDHDDEGVIRGFCVALAGNGAVGAADLFAPLVNWGPWRRQGEMGWVGFEPTSNRL